MVNLSVVLLDELDQLVLAKQTVLYNLFNWPTLPNSRLIVVAIANTMNLADMLPNKIQSRVGTFLIPNRHALPFCGINLRIDTRQFRTVHSSTVN